MSDTGPQAQPDEALMDLLVKQVVEGLSPAEQRALDALDSAIASEYLRDFERAAAAVAVAGAALAAPLPPTLRVRLEQQAQDFFATTRASPAIAVEGSTSAPPATAAAVADNVVPFKTPRRAAGETRVLRSGAAGWFAAAACLVLALFAWFRAPQGDVAPLADQPVSVPPAAAPPPQPPPPSTPAEERAALLARSDSVKVTLAVTKEPAAAGASGDVVWDPRTQSGFLRFVGLAANDPRVRQYQVWIFDGERDQRYPVDGGVFDMPADAGEIVIPIHAELPIRVAKAFAVTVEKPGGVVVSTRAHVVGLGAAG